jgi:hypothetical protein
MVRLGSLMEDLECYVDNSLVFGEDGRIIARKGGIRRYIQSEVPDLYRSYKTLMRYKALARRFRQAVGISDPVPAASALPEGEVDADTGTDAGDPAPKCAKAAESTGNDGKSGNGGGAGLDDEVRRVAREILDVCEGTFLDLASVLALRISEDAIPHRSYRGVRLGVGIANNQGLH